MQQQLIVYEKQIESLLKQIDFHALWPGFHRFPFALYNQQEAVLEGERFVSSEEFRGNTTIRFQGRQIAILRLPSQPEETIEQLCAAIVHEMFHAFQMEQGESRWPDELVLAETIFSPLAFALREQEFCALTQADLPQFCALRDRREGLVENLQEEYRAETIEGMAQYIEFSVLGQLDVQQKSIALSECRNRLTSLSEVCSPRLSAYDSGTLMLFAAEEQGYPIYHKIGEQQRPLYSQLADCLPRSKAGMPSTEQVERWSVWLHHRTEERQRTIDRLLSTAQSEQMEGAVICGYDPIHLWRQGDWLYNANFLLLRDQQSKTKMLTGPVLVKLCPNSNKKVQICYQAK